MGSSMGPLLRPVSAAVPVLLMTLRFTPRPSPSSRIRSANLIEWMLFYEGARSGTDNDTVIGYATSLDGYSWSGFQIPVLEPSSDLVAPPPLRF